MFLYALAMESQGGPLLRWSRPSRVIKISEVCTRGRNFHARALLSLTAPACFAAARRTKLAAADAEHAG